MKKRIGEARGPLQVSAVETTAERRVRMSEEAYRSVKSRVYAWACTLQSFIHSSVAIMLFSTKSLCSIVYSKLSDLPISHLVSPILVTIAPLEAGEDSEEVVPYFIPKSRLKTVCNTYACSNNTNEDRHPDRCPRTGTEPGR